MDVEWMNETSILELGNFLRRCCGCEKWIQRMIEERPYTSKDVVRKAADRHWEQLEDSDYLEAFAKHPMIGDVSGRQRRDSNANLLAFNEQSQVQTANSATLESLVAANAEYKTKFGFTFIVCATGKGADEILTLLQDRLKNSRHDEICHAAEEQRKITHIRLEKLS